MLILSILVYYFAPAIGGLILVGWLYGRFCEVGKWIRMAAIGAAGLAAAPVLTSDGYGAGILPLWLYGVFRLTTPELHKASLLAVLVSWAVTAMACWSAVWLLSTTRTKWGPR